MRDTPQSLMLFAAGFGTRMGAMTAKRPKPLIPVAGRALIDHALVLVENAGIAKTVVNLHYLPDQIRTHLEGRNVDFSDERDLILDTGGGLRFALPLLGDGPVFTLNSDAVWTGANPLVELWQKWDPGRMDGLLVVLPTDQATGHRGGGDFDLDAEGCLIRARGTGRYVYLGAQILRTDGLRDFPEVSFSLNRLWDKMIDNGRLYGAVHHGGWADVGRPEGIALAEALLRGSK
jgi:N-acetyl-alpha-D-muramate 1-phosphate uridylyltransferase